MKEPASARRTIQVRRFKQSGAERQLGRPTEARQAVGAQETPIR